MEQHLDSLAARGRSSPKAFRQNGSPHGSSASQLAIVPTAIDGKNIPHRFDGRARTRGVKLNVPGCQQTLGRQHRALGWEGLHRYFHPKDPTSSFPLGVNQQRQPWTLVPAMTSSPPPPLPQSNGAGNLCSPRRETLPFLPDSNTDRRPTPGAEHAVPLLRKRDAGRTPTPLPSQAP